MSTAKSLYLGIPDGAVYALYEEPSPPEGVRTAVLLCPPWGWDEVAAYRSLKRWSEQLSAAGHPVLRIDLPGTGDSAGKPLEPGQVDAWLTAIDAGAAWLRQATDGGRVALLGVGLGGLLARAARARGCRADELIEWGAPADGRAFLRTHRAFRALQGWGDDPLADAELPEGASEAGGFVISAETGRDLRSLSSGPDSNTRPRRVLLLQRDGMSVGKKGVEDSIQQGSDLQVRPGYGYSLLVSDPEQSRLPDEVVATVAEWLDDGPRGSSVGVPPEVEATDSLELDGVRERPWSMRQPFGRVYGILAEPVPATAPDACAVFFNAGATRHIGPNRMWTETARRWAARGINVLRVDLEAIGESDGDETRFKDVAEFYLPDYADQIALLLAELRRQGLGDRFLLGGLCAGAYWSFVAAQDQVGIESVLMLNPGALVWDPALVADREFRSLSRVLTRHWWRKFLAGEIERGGWGDLIGLVSRRGVQSLRRIGLSLVHGPRNIAREHADALDRVRDNGVRVAMAFSGEEALHGELDKYGLLGELHRWPNLELSELPFADHSLRPIGAQIAGAEVIDRELALLLGDRLLKAE